MAAGSLSPARSTTVSDTMRLAWLDSGIGGIVLARVAERVGTR